MLHFILQKRATPVIHPGSFTQVLKTIQTGDYEKTKDSLKTYDLTSYVPRRRDSHVWAMLNAAVSRKYLLITKLLLGEFQKVNFSLNIGEPLIFSAIKAKDMETIVALVEFGAHLNIHHKGTDTTPLYLAMNLGSMEIVKYLLEKGSNPNYPDESKQTPLHFAVKHEYLDFAEVLLEKGADSNFQDDVSNEHLSLLLSKVEIWSWSS